MKIKPTFRGRLLAFLFILSTCCIQAQIHPRYSYLNNDTTPKPALLKQNMISYGFFSPLNQHLSLQFDRLLSDNMMLSLNAGIITPSLTQSTANVDNSPGDINLQGGGYGEVGVKIFFNPDYNWVGRHQYCMLQGMYVKPQLILSMFSNSSIEYLSPYAYPPIPTTVQYSYAGFAAFINIGGQWIIARTVVIDIYGGLGCNFTNGNPSAPPITNYYSYVLFASNFPLAVSGGINIGIPF